MSHACTAPLVCFQTTSRLPSPLKSRRWVALHPLPPGTKLARLDTVSPFMSQGRPCAPQAPIKQFGRLSPRHDLPARVDLDDEVAATQHEVIAEIPDEHHARRCIAE